MINTAQFRARIEKHIAETQKNHAQRVIDWDEFIVRHKKQWIEENGAEWQKFARSVTRLFNYGNPITQSMIPVKGRWNDLLVWSEPARDEQGRSRPERDNVTPLKLTRVLEALDLLNEPEISPTALARVGIPAQLMAEVSVMLARKP